ncbi:MAG: AsmA-like C-terminal region-containing protein [Methyloligellaceae bacterium]
MVRDLIKLPGKGRALVQLPEHGRRLLSRIPEPVQLGLRKASQRSLRLSLEIFAGLLVLGGVGLFLAYDRLNKGPVSLAFLVPTLETAINRELADVEVKIDDAVVQKSAEGSGVQFRLKNIRLIDAQGAVVAQAPLAAIGLSGRALLLGRIAPGSVDFIGPRLLLFFSPQTGLSLTFSRGSDGSDKGAPTGTAARRGPSVGIPMPEPGMPLIVPSKSKQINLTRTITAAFERARRRETASSYLSRFGVRDAVVVFDQNGKQSYWQVPDFAIDLDHRQKRSILIGQAMISSGNGPWQFNFRTEQSEKQERLTFTAFIQDLVPTAIASKFPNSQALQALDLPISAETSLNLSTTGDLLGAETKLRLSAGHITVPWDRKRPMLIDEGDVHIRYRALDDRVELLPSTVQWGESRATVHGEFVPVSGADGQRTWRFRLQADDAVLAAEEFGLQPMAVDQWIAEGTVTPDAGHLTLSRFSIKAGKAALELQGQIQDGPGSPEVRLAGRITPMSISVLKQIWPKFLAGGAREWVGERVTAGRILGGTFNVNLPAGLLAKIEDGGEVPEQTVTMDLQAADLEIHYITEMPPIRTGAARVQIRGRRFLLEAPNGRIGLPSGKSVELTNGRLAIDDLRPDPQHGEITFDVSGSAASVLELLDHKPLEYAKEVGVKPSEFGGKASGDFKILLPLLKDLKFADVKLRGNAQLNDAKASSALSRARVQGGTVNFSVSEKVLDARGDILINGIPALLSWQRFFGATAGRQPAMRVTTVLDDAARERLGIKVNHALRGPVPVVLSLGHKSGGKPSVHVQADLGNADVILANMGWRKEAGRAAVLKFDVVDGENGQTELQNLKIQGDDIAIDGWVALSAEDRPVAFFFPDLNFNVITHISVSGRLREDNVWEVKADGSAYDGRQFFKSLFSSGQLAEDQESAPEGAPGLDLTANIGAMVGYFDTRVQNVRVELKKRNGRLSHLEAEGNLNGQSAIAVKLQTGEGQPRVVLAESKDAGSAFRLVGFYPRMEGGEASLQVNLDGQGGASKTGDLWARSFNILGDQVVSRVVSAADERSDRADAAGRSSRANQGVERNKIYFNQLHVPFSVGGGQFNLHDSYINGPQLGATMRGSFDFKTQQIDLGGTFVPAYGLNSVFGSIPIIGDLLVGRRGEGVFGITFAVQGPTANPAVRVNPISVVAPGIFRQIFEFRGRYPAPARAPVRQGRPAIGTTPAESFSFPQN